MIYHVLHPEVTPPYLECRECLEWTVNLEFWNNEIKEGDTVKCESCGREAPVYSCIYEFGVGDEVIVSDWSYIERDSSGTVVSSFQMLSGQRRYVVEDGSGNMAILSEEQLSRRV